MSKIVPAKLDGFTPILDAVVKDTSITTAIVYGVIWRHCHMRDGVCRASLESMGEMVGMSRQTFFRHILILEDNKYIIDTTPNLRNKPHVYKDAGKVGIKIRVSGVTESHSDNKSTLPESQRALPESQRHVTTESLEDTKKKELKIQEHANRQVDAILEQERKSKDHWPGREKMPENYRALMDQFVKCTGIKPINGQINDWFATASDWIEIGAHPPDITEAFKRTRPDHNGKGGYPILRPGSLTGMLQAVIGERSATPNTSISSNAVLIAAMEKYEREKDDF